MIRDYRRRYLKGKSGFHICAYCLKPMSTQSMTVDHIIPQHAFRRVRDVLLMPWSLLMFGMKRRGFMNKTSRAIMHLASFLAIGYVAYEMPQTREAIATYYIGASLLVFAFYAMLHSKANLTAACGPCNEAKSAKIDHRVVIGMVSVIFRTAVFKAIALVGIAYFLWQRYGAAIIEKI